MKGVGDISQARTDFVLEAILDGRGVFGEAERVQVQGRGKRSGRSAKESDCGSSKFHIGCLDILMKLSPIEMYMSGLK